MLWIIMGIIAAAAWSIGAFIDNYQTDVIFKGKTPQAVKLANGPFYMLIGVIMAFIFQIHLPEWWQVGLIFLSGAISSLGTFAYYQALKKEEATGATIFYQLQPIYIFLIDYFIFHESISANQIIGFIVLLCAPLAIILANKRAKARIKEISTGLFLVLYVIIATISAEIFIRTSEGLNVFDLLPIFVFARGFTDCIVAFSPKVRRRHKNALKRHGAIYLGSALINSILCAGADSCYRFSLVIGISAIASAITNASELVLTFICGLIFSIIWPQFGREKLQKRIVAGHVIAVILCIIGIIIIQ